MTNSQKSQLDKLKLKIDWNIFQSLNFIQQNIHSNSFILSYNAKSNLWVLKGSFISLISNESNKAKSIHASNLDSLQQKLIALLNQFLDESH